ncbi:expressed unknown protein [Seminavis robusta]|uniref:Uncharacterized protein n=1 Tax=Seminavis robusta TaxID=568900 RepID=A0A9N8ETQ0_9STRA|nr:expressed unknown protein [Seminavis robusta]|eukprot:Sro1845_g301310.1 n/a (247) ;mRNA; f:18916-19656
MDQAAADLNNVAVAYLERGDLRRALELFRTALRTTMGELRPAGAPPLVPPPMPPQEQQHQAAGQGPANNDNRQHPRDTKPEFNSPGTPFVHCQGFGIVGTPGSYSPDPLINTTVISTIIIFNLAVVYHLKGLHEKALNESRLHKARSLYVKAHLLLNDAGVSYGSTGNAVVDLLSMAVSNNLAQVSYELSSYDESRAHFDGLIRFALTVVPSRYGDRYVGSIMDQQKSNFLLNAIILHAPNLAPAA